LIFIIRDFVVRSPKQ